MPLSTHRLLPALLFAAAVCSPGLTPLHAQTPRNVRPLSARPGENWKIRWNRSDDFNGTQVDWRKWLKKPEQFGAWSWDNDANVKVENGHLVITLRRGPMPPATKKKRGGRRPTPYSSGMLKSYAAGAYGYYEARIKGAHLFPGASPAFWIYSRIDDSVVEAGKVRYCEVDIVELTQRSDGAPGNERISDHNLHAILSNGQRGVRGRDWQRPHDPKFKADQAIEYRLPFDPRDDFHTYGCRVDRDVIIWYVDGVEVGRKKNEHWHRKMNVALSLGLRPPYARWENNRLVPNLEIPGDGFPTSMKVDYVRVWELE